jgi:7-keto-8-aminopelargonate synthetase-like enzyme
MSALSKGIRQKRFRINEGADAKVVLDTRMGERIVLKLENCSINGLGARSAEKVLTDEEWEIGAIIPAAKIVVQNQEIPLGRLTVRYVVPDQGLTGSYFGMATVDGKLPIDGVLSHYIYVPENGEINPYEFELSPQKYSLASFVEQQDTNVDLFARCRKFDKFNTEWEKTDRYSYHTVREASTGARVKLKRSRAGGRNDYIQMAAYDYLNLGSHPEVTAFAAETLKKYGYSSGGSPLICGTTDLHEQLAEKLARMLGKEKVLLFSSGYAANVGAIQGLTAGQDLIVADVLSHASLHDGIKMSPATARFYKHNNPQHLETIFKEHRASHMGALMITEGVFSMDGDMGNLSPLIAIAKKYNARTFVDEAHSFGLYGAGRKGVSELTRTLDDVDIYMSSLSKVCGSGGGFIAGNKEVMDWLHFYGRSRMFSGSMPPSSAAAGLKSLEILLLDQERINRLFSNVKHFVAGMRELGAPLSADHNSPIVPIVIGNEAKIGPINQHLLESGVFVVPIVFPAVSRTQCRFRFSLMSDHSVSDLDYAVSTFAQAMKKADFSFDQLRQAA